WRAKRATSLATAAIFWEATRHPESSGSPDIDDKTKTSPLPGVVSAGPLKESTGPSGIQRGVHLRSPPVPSARGADHDPELRSGAHRALAARAPEALCPECEDAWGGPGREDRRVDGEVR